MSGNKVPVIVFAGTTPNIGTTCAAFATAWHLAKQSAKPIAFLCLNLKSSKLHCYLGVEQREHTLGKLAAELRASQLSETALLETMYKVPENSNLFVLFGNQNREQAEFYLPGHIELLLQRTKSLFSAVIVDVSAYWDNAATICAMQRGDRIVMVSTAALSHFQEDVNGWLAPSKVMYRLEQQYFEAILIQFPWKYYAFRQTVINKEIGMPVAACMELSESLFASLDQGTYMSWLEENGKKQMSSYAKVLAKKYGLLQTESKQNNNKNKNALYSTLFNLNRYRSGRKRKQNKEVRF